MLGPFETFGPPHLTAMAVIVAAGVSLPVLAGKVGSARLTRAICGTIAVVLLANETAFWAHGLATMELRDFLAGGLPLHICGAAVFLVAWTLWRPQQYVYEIAYFWGLAGTAQAILTPNLQMGYPSYQFFQFFVTHGSIVIGVLFATLALKMRPRRGAVVRTIVVTNLYMVAVAGVDWALGANYMFLCRPPEGASPFFFLPWPWYLLVLEAVGLAMILLLCLPFVFHKFHEGDELHEAESTEPGANGTS